MTGRAKAAAAVTALGAAVVGVVAGVQLTGGPASPRGLIGQAVTGNCHHVPGKFWGGRWHYSPAILRPTRVETYCVTYPTVGRARTLVKFSYAPVVAP